MNELSKRVEAISDQNVFSCNQCGNCSAGCMFTEEMSVLPHQTIACGGANAELSSTPSLFSPQAARTNIGAGIPPSTGLPPLDWLRKILKHFS